MPVPLVAPAARAIVSAIVSALLAGFLGALPHLLRRTRLALRCSLTRPLDTPDALLLLTLPNLTLLYLPLLNALALLRAFADGFLPLLGATLLDALALLRLLRVVTPVLALFLLGVTFLFTLAPHRFRLDLAVAPLAALHGLRFRAVMTVITRLAAAVAGARLPARMIVRARFCP